MSKIVKLNYGTGSDPTPCGMCDSGDWDWTVYSRGMLKNITPREMSAYMRGIKLKNAQKAMAKQKQPNLPVARGNGVGVI